MDQACIEAREYLRSRWREVQELHPEYADIGTPAYMNAERDRLCFYLKLTSGSRKSVQYARILLELKLGRVLTGDETVDHVDFNRRNNDMSNLQMLHRSANARKGASDDIKRKSANITSARMLGNKYGSGQKNGMSKLCDATVSEIRELQKNHFRGQDKVLAEQFNVSRELISQIRRGKVRIVNALLETPDDQ